MILEGIVTTVSENCKVNIAPMGPIVDKSMQSFLLRPFTSSTTYRNLKQNGHGVLHVTDDVLLIAKAAISRLAEPFDLVDTPDKRGKVIANACRWYQFDVVSLDDSRERTEIRCQVAAEGKIRDFFGFNRAKHAVIEAAILATRIGILPNEDIAREIPKLQTIVEKTAGDDEREAFQIVSEFISKQIDAKN